MTKLIILGLTFASTVLISLQLWPLWSQRFSRYQSKKVKEATKKLDIMFMDVPAKKLTFLHISAPIGLGLLGFFLSKSLFIALACGGFGLVLPSFIIKKMEAKRRKDFQSQLVDGLMILSSSLRGGLSLLQAMEVLVEEMPPPISEEIGLVVRENKMGTSLEESLDSLCKRMKSEELNLAVTAILVARETGGDLTETFGELTSTIREKEKLVSKVRTLSTQGKLQGLVMSILPVAFAIIIYTMNPGSFNTMLQNPIGQALLIYAVISELIGVFLIKKISKVEV